MVDSLGVDRDRKGLINSEVTMREVAGENVIVIITSRECQTALFEGNKGFNYLLPLDAHIVYTTYNGDVVSTLVSEIVALNPVEPFYVFNIFGKPIILTLKELKVQTIGWPDRHVNFVEGNLIIRS